MRLDELIGAEPARSLLGIRATHRTPMPVKHKSEIKSTDPATAPGAAPSAPVAPAGNIGAFDTSGGVAPIAASV